MVGYGYLTGGAGAFHRIRSSLTRSVFGSIPASSFAPWSIHFWITTVWPFGTGDRLSLRGGIRRSFSETIRVNISLSACLPGEIPSPPAPPVICFSNVVMSYLPDRFLASWQAKQFSFRIGATSLMKLTGFSWALTVEMPSTSQAARAVRTAQRIHRRVRVIWRLGLTWRVLQAG